MQTEVVISGFGGQGALFAGQVLAHAGMHAGQHVSWLPSYGPEMRGGTAHCIVIVSDQEIGSPVVRNPAIAVVMNNPSMDRYESLIRPGGLLVVNSSLVTQVATRPDILALPIAANALAEELGGVRLANLVLLGALLAARPIVPMEAVLASLAEHLSERHRHLLQANQKALQRGAEAARQAMPQEAKEALWPA
jgi:2-oxoglutarate ferredoxin oxidoreductase subunit gamma